MPPLDGTVANRILHQRMKTAATISPRRVRPLPGQRKRRPSPSAEITEAIRLCDSYSRLPTLIEWFHKYSWVGGTRTRQQWFQALGLNWNICDNVGVYEDYLRDIFRRYRRSTHLMMDDAVYERFLALPETVTVYRGCGPDNQRGLCWSTNRDISAGFPSLGRYRQNTPPLLTARAPKRYVVACVDDERAEQEIIVALPDCFPVECERLPPPGGD